MKLRVWAVPAVAALLLLTGCDQLSPGTASVVNGTRITNDEVEAVADAQCVAADEAAQAAAPRPRRCRACTSSPCSS